jgi:hypothetical protein
VLLRLIIWAVLFYLIFKFLGKVFRSILGISQQERSEVKGKAKNESFKIDDQDIEDADFEEIK